MSLPPLPDEPNPAPPSADVWRRPPGGAPPPPELPPTAPRIEPPRRPTGPDEAWARPDSWSTHPGGTVPPDSVAPAPPARATYPGPPKAGSPPSGWKPATVVAVPLANTLPPQHDEAVDAIEAQAKTITYGVAMIAGAVLLVMLLVICARWLSL